ncbi:hypothetical protein ASD89_07690 [Caulobacter sp. Root656]|nr:hypothetical protein ASD89_07690 [Caulobacter sp. Root656]
MALLDPATGFFRWVGYDTPDRPAFNGTDGLCRTRGGVVAMEQVYGGGTWLTRYDIDLTPGVAEELPDIADGHDLRAWRGGLVVADTGHDRIAWVRAGKPVKTLWRASAADADTQHVNSVEVVGGRVLATAFGEKPEDGWRTARGGYVVDCARGEILASGIAQPHSLVAEGAALWWCESANSTLWRQAPGEKARPQARLRGYLRGLMVTDRHIVVGASARRRRSRHLGVTVPIARDSLHVDESLIYVIDRRTGGVTVSSIMHAGSEVFAIAAAPRGLRRPSLDDTLSAMTARFEAAAVAS